MRTNLIINITLTWMSASSPRKRANILVLLSIDPCGMSTSIRQ